MSDTGGDPARVITGPDQRWAAHVYLPYTEGRVGDRTFRSKPDDECFQYQLDSLATLQHLATERRTPFTTAINQQNRVLPHA